MGLSLGTKREHMSQAGESASWSKMLPLPCLKPFHGSLLLTVRVNMLPYVSNYHIPHVGDRVEFF